MATATTDRSLTKSTQVPGQRAGDAPLGADGDAPPAPSRRKKLLMRGVVLLLALLAAGGGGYFMLMGGAPTAEEAAAAEAEAAAAEVPEPGVVVPLEPVTINLADGRYLQVGIALQQPVPGEGDPGEEDALDGSHALDILIDKLSGRPMSDIASAEQRGAIKAELVAEIGEAYHGHVYDIYFTSFVMQ